MTYTASVSFGLIWINDPTNPNGPFVNCGSAGSLGGGPRQAIVKSQTGSFRQYASNRTALILGQTVTTTWPLVLRNITNAQRVQIEQWIGTILLFRDSYGQRLFGAYLATPELPLPFTAGLPVRDGGVNGQSWDVQLDITGVTYREVL